MTNSWLLLIVLGLSACSSPPVEPVDERYNKKSETISQDVPKDVFDKFADDNSKVDKVLKASKKPKKKPEKEKSEPTKKTPETMVNVPKKAPGEPVINKCDDRFPFKIGEKFTWDINYFLVSAGTINAEVAPLTTLNNRPSIHFKIHGKTYPKFSSLVYKIEDTLDSYVDLDTFVSYKMELDRKESRVTGHRIEIFDQVDEKSYFWQVQDDKKKGHEEKKYTAVLSPGSIDPMSILFYARCLNLKELNKEYYIPLHTEGKNRVTWIRVDRKEKITTDLGELDTVVLKSRMILNGVLQTGDAFEVWFTDDDRKIPVRLKVKVKIGSVYGEILEYHEGTKSLVQ